MQLQDSSPHFSLTRLSVYALLASMFFLILSLVSLQEAQARNPLSEKTERNDAMLWKVQGQWTSLVITPKKN